MLGFALFSKDFWMKNIFLFLLILAGRFVDAQDSARFSLKWDEYNWSFEKDFKDFKQGWYYGYGFHHDTGEDLVKQIGFCIQKVKKIKVDFIPDTLGWNELGYEIDTNLKIAPNPQVILYYANGKVKAKVDILPFFVRQKTLIKSIQQCDSAGVVDEEGDLFFKAICLDFPLYDLPYEAFKLIKHGYYTLFDTLGNQISKCYFHFDKAKSGTEAAFGGEYEVISMKYFIEDGYKTLDISYDKKDSANRIETLYYTANYDDVNYSEIESKIYVKNLLRYEYGNVGSCVKAGERWYNENHMIVQSLDYEKCSENGFYFKLNQRLDTLERGYFIDGFKDGHWAQYDTSINHHIIFSGNFDKGKGIGKHSYFNNGILSRELQYKLFSFGSIPLSARYQKITNQKDLCKISYRKDFVFTAKDIEIMYVQFGKIKQEIIYDPYNIYIGVKDACFDADYIYPYEYGVLDGVYIPANTTKMNIPSLSIGWGNQLYDKSIIYSKINYDSGGAETSRLVFQNGRAYQGINIVYDSNGNEKSTTEYHLGKIVKK